LSKRLPPSANPPFCRTAGILLHSRPYDTKFRRTARGQPQADLSLFNVRNGNDKPRFGHLEELFESDRFISADSAMSVEADVWRHLRWRCNESEAERRKADRKSEKEPSVGANGLAHIVAGARTKTKSKARGAARRGSYPNLRTENVGRKWSPIRKGPRVLASS